MRNIKAQIREKMWNYRKKYLSQIPPTNSKTPHVFERIHWIRSLNMHNLLYREQDESIKMIK